MDQNAHIFEQTLFCHRFIDSIFYGLKRISHSFDPNEPYRLCYWTLDPTKKENEQILFDFQLKNENYAINQPLQVKKLKYKCLFSLQNIRF